MVHGGRALHRAAFGCYGAPTRSIGPAADATGHPPVPSARPTRWYRVPARSIETAPHAQAHRAVASARRADAVSYTHLTLPTILLV